MQYKDTSQRTHSHDFNQEKKTAETKTLIVVIVTLTAMVVEIVAGWYFNSMALFADGWHMMTHAAALSISLFAYVLARKLATDRRFAFGTWKIEIPGASTSAIILGIAGLFVLIISVNRIYNPVNISYNQALLVASIGLAVNIVSALILREGHDHNHHRRHEHPLHNDDSYNDVHHDQNNHTNSHHHTHNVAPLDHHTHVSLRTDNHTQHNHKSIPNNHHSNNKTSDLNLKSAYLHVIADALTSVLAIIALLGTKYYDWNFLDPAMGIVGAVLIFRWTYLLIRETASILLDHEMDEALIQQVTNKIETDDNTKVTDIHFWRVAQYKYACVLSIVTQSPNSAIEFKSKLKSIHELTHLTIEVNHLNEHDQ